MFEGKGADTEDGVVCTSHKKGLVDEEWIKITNEGLDPRYCDKKKHCSTDIDEPHFCYNHRVVVSGSGTTDIDGTFERVSHFGQNVYKQKDKNNFIFRQDGAWKISTGAPGQAIVRFESQKSTILPSKGWTKTINGENQENNLGNAEDLVVTVESTGNQMDDPRTG